MTDVGGGRRHQRHGSLLGMGGAMKACAWSHICAAAGMGIVKHNMSRLLHAHRVGAVLRTLCIAALCVHAALFYLSTFLRYARTFLPANLFDRMLGAWVVRIAQDGCRHRVDAPSSYGQNALSAWRYWAANSPSKKATWATGRCQRQHSHSLKQRAIAQRNGAKLATAIAALASQYLASRQK